MANFDHMIGRPWTDEYDCRNVSHDVLTALGFDVPAAWLALPCNLSAEDKGAECASTWAEYQRTNGDAWARIGGNAAAATAAGDVLVSTCMHDAGELHLSVLVDPSRKLVMTSTRSMGAHMRPAASLFGVRDVFRFEGAA